MITGRVLVPRGPDKRNFVELCLHRNSADLNSYKLLNTGYRPKFNSRKGLDIFIFVTTPNKNLVHKSISNKLIFLHIHNVRKY